jgi:DNA-binding response OmpR family regulator
MTHKEVRLLIVEDDDDLRDVMQLSLAGYGYTVETAPDAETAMKLVDDFKPACVLLDLGLPGMNGIELTRRIRARHGREMLLVVLTGWSREDYSKATEAAGVDHVMLKPFDVNSLLNVLPKVA